MTTIGILGSGHVGSNLAQAAITHGYDVVLSNSQGPETLADLVKNLGPSARAATPAEAAAEGDFAIVAIPIGTIDQVPVEPLAGKVVIATINYFPQRLGHIPEIDDGTTTAPGLLQAHLPTSRVVRAFSMINAAEMSGDGHPARRQVRLQQAGGRGGPGVDRRDVPVSLREVVDRGDDDLPGQRPDRHVSDGRERDGGDGEVARGGRLGGGGRPGPRPELGDQPSDRLRPLGVAEHDVIAVRNRRPGQVAAHVPAAEDPDGSHADVSLR